MVELDSIDEDKLDTSLEDVSSNQNNKEPFFGKKKKFKLLLLIVIIIIFIFILSFAFNKSDNKMARLNVTFDTDGGSDISSQKVKYNDVLSIPIEPDKMGYVFDGWYLGDKLYDFNTPVKKDIKLVAHWKEYETLPVSGIKLDQEKATILKNTTISLVAYIEPFNAENLEVKWASSDESVATVDKYGKVKALKEGRTIITAETVEGGFKANCEIIVSKTIVSVENVSFNKLSITLSNGTSYKLNPIIIPSHATNQGITWSTSDEAVATVVNGLITAHKDGEATITATTKDGNKSTSIVVYVKNIPLTGVKITGARDMKQGDTLALDVQFTPVNSTEKNLIWSSNNTNVIEVNQNGLLTAKGVGTASITVKTKDGKFYDSVNIKSTNSVSVYNIILDKKELTLNEGENGNVVATIYPKDAKNKNVIWTSSDESVAKVSNGKISAIKSGTATIRAITSDGGYKATCVVNVQKKEPVYTYIVDEKKEDPQAPTYYYVKVYSDNEDITKKVDKIAGINLKKSVNVIVIADANKDKLSDTIEFVMDGEVKLASKKILNYIF